MKREILETLRKLGGDISRVKGASLQEDLLSITFDTVLYSGFRSHFEIYELEDFYSENKALFLSDKDEFSSKLLEKYFCLTDEGYRQKFWRAEMFTPFRSGTEDHKEWNGIFNKRVDLTEIRKITDDTQPDFLLLFESYGCPDHYYICLSDPNPENPTVFGTDHEVFFREISNQGSLSDFLGNFFTKDEFLEIAFETIEQEGFAEGLLHRSQNFANAAGGK